MRLYMLINPHRCILYIQSERVRERSDRKRTPGERDPVRATFLRGGLCKTKSTGPTGSPATFYRLSERGTKKREEERKRDGGVGESACIASALAAMRGERGAIFACFRRR